MSRCIQRSSGGAVLAACLLLVGASAPAAFAQSGTAARSPGGVQEDSTLDLSTVRTDIRTLVSSVENLSGKVQDLEVKETDLEIRIDLAADVLFDFDKSDIKPQAAATLKQAASFIRGKAKGIVKIVGYTDAKGSDAYNQKLSERRAGAVKNWLASKEGLANVRFSTEGLGPRNPVAPNTKPDGSDDPEGRQKNRRVEIIVKKQ